MSRESCPRIVRRCATALVSGTVALTLAAAPSLAQAGQPSLLASNMPTTGMKLRSIMSLQDPADPAEAEAPATDAAAPAPTGPAPAPAPAPMGPEPPKGLGLLIPGAIITGGIALPITVLGVVRLIQFNKLQREAEDLGTAVVGTLGKGASIAIIVTGLLFLAAGAPMLGVGAARLAKHQKWKNGQQALLPSMNRTAHGTWTGGFTLRF